MKSDVLILGRDGLADAVEASLRRCRRRVERVVDVARVGGRLRAGQALLMTAAADLASVLPAVAGYSARGRGSALRLLLLSEQGAPLPDGAVVGGGDVPVEQIDIPRSAARLLLARWPLHVGFDPPFGQQVHLVIAGRTPLADALLVHALRLAHYSECQPVMTLIDDDPAAWERDFAVAHPRAGSFSRPRFRRPEQVVSAADAPVSGVIVCAKPATAALELGERLARRIAAEQGVSPAILLDVDDAEPDGGLDDWDGQLLPFSPRRLVLTPEVLLDGRGDELAQVIHAHYRDTSAAQGRDPDVEPASQPWDRLADSYRHANRHQADHLWAKLAVTDCRAVPEDLVESFAFAPNEVERLAVIEHARWAADRYLDGWSYAPVRDNVQKHHPQLIPYADLSRPMKDLDRFAVRLVPALLARSGRGLVRMLIIAVPETAVSAPVGRLRPWVDQVLRRLLARYPDRGLVIAATLADPASRLLARRAMQLAEVGLFLLCPRPLPTVLAAQPDAEARREVLALVARAERRIPLPEEGALERWLDTRAEILVRFGAAAEEVGQGEVGRKQVRVDPERGLAWNFEY